MQRRRPFHSTANVGVSDNNLKGGEQREIVPHHHPPGGNDQHSFAWKPEACRRKEERTIGAAGKSIPNTVVELSTELPIKPPNCEEGEARISPRVSYSLAKRNGALSLLCQAIIPLSISNNPNPASRIGEMQSSQQEGERLS